MSEKNSSKLGSQQSASKARPSKSNGKLKVPAGGVQDDVPRPGMAARGTRSGRPAMALFDLLGRRWSLRLLWELRETSKTFRGLRAAMEDVSPSVLNQRLGELRRVALVELGNDGYGLTDLGRELLVSLAPVFVWSNRWAAQLAD